MDGGMRDEGEHEMDLLSIEEEQKGVGTVCFCERFRQIHQSVTHNGVDGPRFYEDCCSFISATCSPATTHCRDPEREREREMGESRKKDDNNKGIEQTGRETRRKGRNLYYNMLH
jgi:hypothetical protein